MTLEQFHAFQEQTFDSFITRLITNEGKNARKQIARRAEKEIAMSQLLDSELARLASTDTYDIEEMTFSINNETVIVKDMLLGQAIASLPPMRREVILLSYFLGESDTQIAKSLNLTPNAIRYRRQTTLQRLKGILEVLANEK